jgi:hypothetical protein
MTLIKVILMTLIKVMSIKGHFDDLDQGYVNDLYQGHVAVNKSVLIHTRRL